MKSQFTLPFSRTNSPLIQQKIYWAFFSVAGSLQFTFIIMVVPGAIRWKDTSRNKRWTPVRRDTASQRNAAQLKLEADEAFDLLDHFMPQDGLRRHPQDPPPSPPFQGFEFEPNADDGNGNDDEHDDPPSQLAQYLRSRKYREKRARNAELWNEVLPSIFVEFMQLRPKTSSWGHPDLWDKDWHVCDCRDEHVRYRDIDMVDILSPFLSILIIDHQDCSLQTHQGVPSSNLSSSLQEGEGPILSMST